MSAVVFDRRNVIKHFLKTLIQEPLIGCLLHLNEVRHLQHFLLAEIAHAHALAAASGMKPDLITHSFTSFCRRPLLPIRRSLKM